MSQYKPLILPVHQPYERHGRVKVLVVGGKVLDKPQWIEPPPIERTLQKELFTPARKDVFRQQKEAEAAEKEARRKGLIL